MNTLVDGIPRARVGVGVVLRRGDRVLLGRRKGSHGAGEYGGPGGHLEHLESVEECARREVLEETGLDIGRVQFLCLSNVRTYAPKHYVDIGVVAEWISGEPHVLESDKIDRWDWHDLNDMPKPLFSMWPKYLIALKTGERFFEV